MGPVISQSKLEDSYTIAFEIGFAQNFTRSFHNSPPKLLDTWTAMMYTKARAIRAARLHVKYNQRRQRATETVTCLLYTSDAADDM
eukprot:2987538-Alexandrium_andersonii.AAC.1